MIEAQHEKITKYRENLYCALSEMVAFAYCLFAYFLTVFMVELVKIQ